MRPSGDASCTDRSSRTESSQVKALSGNGAQEWNRTTDTAIFSRMLYQLSYLGPAERRLLAHPSILIKRCAPPCAHASAGSSASSNAGPGCDTGRSASAPDPHPRSAGCRMAHAAPQPAGRVRTYHRRGTPHLHPNPQHPSDILDHPVRPRRRIAAQHRGVVIRRARAARAAPSISSARTIAGAHAAPDGGRAPPIAQPPLCAAPPAPCHAR